MKTRQTKQAKQDMQAAQGSGVQEQAYRSIAQASSAEIEEKKSRFIAHAAPVSTEEEALAFLQELKKEHPSARHHVYAYVLRKDQRSRYTDDGEPQKTAGLPVLDLIKARGLSDIIIVVIRYFGGTLLGTGGLIRAYSLAASQALAAAEIVDYQLCQDLILHLPYNYYDQLVFLAGKHNAELISTTYGQEVELQLRFLAGEEQKLLYELEELFKGDKPWRLTECSYKLFKAAG